MTKKDKKLLLIDLCARLPYGVICTDNRHGDSKIFNVDIEDESVYYTDFDEYGLVENCKPYLRPMSSMTNKEKKEYRSLSDSLIVKYGPLDFTFDLHHIRLGIKPGNPHETIDDFIDMSAIDWLNAHHFDYRGLIEKGLALEAPKDMYNFSKKIVSK